MSGAFDLLTVADRIPVELARQHYRASVSLRCWARHSGQPPPRRRRASSTPAVVVRFQPGRACRGAQRDPGALLGPASLRQFRHPAFRHPQPWRGHLGRTTRLPGHIGLACFERFTRCRARCVSCNRPLVTINLNAFRTFRAARPAAHDAYGQKSSRITRRTLSTPPSAISRSSSTDLANASPWARLATCRGAAERRDRRARRTKS